MINVFHRNIITAHHIRIDFNNLFLSVFEILIKLSQNTFEKKNQFMKTCEWIIESEDRASNKLNELENMKTINFNKGVR